MPFAASGSVSVLLINDAPADYVAAKIKGAGPVTKSECLAYFGPGVARCDTFPDTKSEASH